MVKLLDGRDCVSDVVGLFVLTERFSVKYLWIFLGISVGVFNSSSVFTSSAIQLRLVNAVAGRPQAVLVNSLSLSLSLKRRIFSFSVWSWDCLSAVSLVRHLTNLGTIGGCAESTTAFDVVI